jgi:hypothetical protein
MSALARARPSPMECHSAELDHERRFQPAREALETFLRAVGPFTESRMYAMGYPYAFTRTTYFDTQNLDLLASGKKGQAQRLRLREYAGAAELGQPPVLTGPRFLEVKETAQDRRMKVRFPVSAEEAEALLSGALLPEGSLAGGLLRRFTQAPVRPWVTAWYRRTSRASSDDRVRITLDEDLTFALPPVPGNPAAPTRLLYHAPTSLLEVKWQGRSPLWLEQALWPLTPSETRGSKFEQGMRALLGSALPLLLSMVLLLGSAASAQAPAAEPAEAPAAESEATAAPEPKETDGALVVSTAAGSVEVGGRLDVRETLERPQGGIWAGELTIPTARVEVSYRWKKRLRAVVEFDARGELKDVFVWLKIANGFSTRAGRFKLPLSLIELESATKLPLVRRGLLRDVLDDALNLSGRSPGAQLEWKCPGCTQDLKLQAGVWQTRDPDTKIALERGLGLLPALRGTWQLGGFQVGASALLQPEGASPGGDQSSWLTALDVRHTLPLGSGALRTWAEAITGRAAPIGGTGNLLMGRAVTAWRLGGAERGNAYLEPFVLLSAMDPDLDGHEDLLWEGALGLNAGQWERWRVQAQFEVRKAEAGVPPVLEALEESLASRRALLVQLEVGF